MALRITHWLLTLLLSSGALAVRAADVTITVNGKVVARPCTVISKTATVALDDLHTFNLLSPGAASQWHSVVLDLTHCPIGTSQVIAKFSGMTDSTGYYKNLGSASNIQLELQDSNGMRLNNGAQKIVQVDEATQSASFPLQVRALTVNGNATQGNIQAVITITYTYA
ncbi:MAG: fimbrial protein [Enterobacteriaceae bacterium]